MPVDLHAYNDFSSVNKKKRTSLKPVLGFKVPGVGLASFHLPLKLSVFPSPHGLVWQSFVDLQGARSSLLVDRFPAPFRFRDSICFLQVVFRAAYPVALCRNHVLILSSHAILLLSFGHL